MPRAAREKSETGLYHIMLRGMDHRAIFMDDEDCQRFLETLEKVREVSGFKLFAYYLMWNKPKAVCEFMLANDHE